MKPAITPQMEDPEWVVGLIECTPPEFRGPPRDLQPPGLSQSWPKASGAWLHPVQLPPDQPQAPSVRGGTKQMQPQLGLHGIPVKEVDGGRSPGRRQGVPGGLARQQQLGRELQA